MYYSHINTKGVKYFLHSTLVILRGGNREQTIYYFAKKLNLDKACDLPRGFEVVENKRTGLPCLRKA